VEKAMLCIDLTQPGTVIDGNRAKNRTQDARETRADSHAFEATTSPTPDADTAPDKVDTAAAEED
jgi:hypothetical protein